TVAAHRMAADRAHVAGGRVGFHPGRQLVDDVVVHAVVLRPRLAGGVEVEAGAFAQVVAIGVGDIVATRTGVGRDQDDAVLGGVALRAGLGDEILLVAGQAREPVQHRAGPVSGLRRKIHADGHLATQDLGAVAVDGLPASEAGAVFDAFHGS